MEKALLYSTLLSLFIALGFDKEPVEFVHPMDGIVIEDTSGFDRAFLIEPFTNVSCGACPLAHHEIETIESEQSDVFHMTHYLYGPLHHPYTQYLIDQVNKTVYTPLALVHRTNNDGSTVYYDVDRMNEILEGRRHQEAVPGVEVDVTIAQEMLEIDVELNFSDELLEDNVALNVILIEKTVVGEGSGYDQRNYGDKDESHPYYGQGKYIEGFEHTNVIRQVITRFDGMEVQLKNESEMTSFNLPLDNLDGELSNYALVVFVTESPQIGSPILNVSHTALAGL